MKKHLKSKIVVLLIVLQKGIVSFESTRWFPNGALLQDVGVALDFWTAVTFTRLGKAPAMHMN